MKVFKTMFLGSLTALLFTNAANANLQQSAEETLKVDPATHIELELQSALADIQRPNLKLELSHQLNKTQLELHTDMLVATANDSLPANQFKVVIAE